jgi:rod shape-determining protein MreD
LRYLLLGLLPLLGIFLQSTVFHYLAPGGVIPDLVLILVVCHGLYNGSVRGGVYGVIFGFIEDIFCGRLIGVNALCKGVIGYLIGKLYPRVYRERILTGVLGVLAASAGSSLLRIILAYFFYQDFAYVQLEKLFIHIVYNVLLTFPIYLWYYHSSHYGWLQKKTENDADD